MIIKKVSRKINFFLLRNTEMKKNLQCDSIFIYRLKKYVR